MTDLPWICPGLNGESRLLSDPGWFSRLSTGAVVDIWALAEDQSRFDRPLLNKMNAMVEPGLDSENPRREITLINGGLVHLPRLEVGNRQFRIDGRPLAIDFNAINILRDLRETYGAAAHASRAATEGQDLPFAEIEDQGRGLDYFVQSRELHYFFHFMTETLPYLAAIAEHGGSGRIFLCDINPPPAYVMDFIATIFPELAPRITFRRQRGEVRNVLVPCDFLNLAQLSGAIPFPAVSPRVDMLRRDPFSLSAQSTAFQNSQCVLMRRLRWTALGRVLSDPRAEQPRRLIISRSRAAHRQLVDEDALATALAPLGFRRVFPEDLSARDQIRLFAGAEIILGAHGAGLTNMLFCQPDCHVIELTQRQYLHRVRHFIRIADTARCRFEAIVCDELGARPEMRFNLGNDIRLGPEGIARLLAHIGEIIAGRYRPFQHDHCRLAEARRAGRLPDPPRRRRKEPDQNRA